MSEQLIFGEGDDCPCIAIHVREDGSTTIWEWPNIRECSLGMREYGFQGGDYHVHYVDVPLFAINCP